MDAFISDERLTSIVSPQPAEIRWCETGEFRAMAESNPELSNALFLSLIGRYYQLCIDLSIRSYETSPLRISRELLRYSDSIGDTAFELPRNTLAELSGVSAKTGIRFLSELINRGALLIAGNTLQIQDIDRLRKISRINPYYERLDSNFRTLVASLYDAIIGCTKTSQRISLGGSQSKNENSVAVSGLEAILSSFVATVAPFAQKAATERIPIFQDSLRKVWVLMAEGVRPDIISEVVGTDILEYLPLLSSQPTRFPPSVIKSYFEKYGIDIAEVSALAAGSSILRLSAPENIDVTGPVPAPPPERNHLDKRQEAYLLIYQTIQLPEPDLIDIPITIKKLKEMLRIQDYDRNLILTNAKRLGLWELVYASNPNVSYKTIRVSFQDTELALEYIKDSLPPREIERLTRCKMGPLMRKLIDSDIRPELIAQYSEKYFIESGKEEGGYQKLRKNDGLNSLLDRLRTTPRGELVGYPGTMASKIEGLLNAKGTDTAEIVGLARNHGIWEIICDEQKGIEYKKCGINEEAFESAIDMMQRLVPPKDIERETSYRIGTIVRRIIRERPDVSDALTTYEDTYFILNTGKISRVKNEANTVKPGSLNSQILASISNGTEFDFEGRPYRGIASSCRSLLRKGIETKGVSQFINTHDLWECYYVKPDSALPKRKLNEEEMNTARDLLYRGIPPREIEKEVNHGIGAVFRQLKKNRSTDPIKLDEYKSRFLSPASL